MKPTSGALRYFGRIKNGTTPASGEAEYWDGDVLWATPEDLGKLSGDRISHTRRRVTDKAVQESNLSTLPVGSVIISTRAPIGHMAITDAPMTFNQGCRGIIPGGRVHSPFLYYLLKSRASELSAIANGTTFVELSRDELAAVVLEFPPLDTQRRIARFLDEKTARIDRLIEKKRALLDRLAEKRQALITRAVTKGLNPDVPMKPSGIEWLGDIPAHWEVQRLDRLTEPRRPIRYGIVLPGPHVEDGVPIIKGGDVRPERLSLDRLSRTTPEIDGAHSRSRLKAGDIVYSIRGSFGDVELLPAELDGVNLTQDAARIAPVDEVDREWLLLTLKSDAFRLQMAAGAVGATIKGINIRDLRRALLPLPPFAEQETLKSWLKDWVTEIDRQRGLILESCMVLEEYRGALITAAVTGQMPDLC